MSNYAIWTVEELGARIVEWRERLKNAKSREVLLSIWGEIEKMESEFDTAVFENRTEANPMREHSLVNGPTRDAFDALFGFGKEAAYETAEPRSVFLPSGAKFVSVVGYMVQLALARAENDQDVAGGCALSGFELDALEQSRVAIAQAEDDQLLFGFSSLIREPAPGGLHRLRRVHPDDVRAAA